VESRPLRKTASKDSPEWIDHFRACSNELVTPKILLCPTHREKTAALNWSSAAGYDNVSYFVGLSAEESKPQTLLTGDANIIGGGGGLNPYWNASVGSSIDATWENNQTCAKRKRGAVDGSVQLRTTPTLRELISTALDIWNDERSALEAARRSLICLPQSNYEVLPCPHGRPAASVIDCRARLPMDEFALRLQDTNTLIQIQGDPKDDWRIQTSTDLVTWSNLTRHSSFRRNESAVALCRRSHWPAAFYRALKTSGLFDPSLFRTVSLTFTQSNWGTLLANARFERINVYCNMLTLDNGATNIAVGARYKGQHFLLEWRQQKVLQPRVRLDQSQRRSDGLHHDQSEQRGGRRNHHARSALLHRDESIHAVSEGSDGASQRQRFALGRVFARATGERTARQRMVSEQRRRSLAHAQMRPAVALVLVDRIQLSLISTPQTCPRTNPHTICARPILPPRSRGSG
jgi:hypothetical protein